MSEMPDKKQADMSDPESVAAMVGRVLPHGDTAFRRLGLELTEIGPDHAVVTMTVTEDALNSVGIAHGGFLFTFADCCSALAGCSRGVQNILQQASVNFLKPGQLGDRLTATGDVITRSGRSGICDITVRNQKDEILLTVRGLIRNIGQAIEEK